MAPASSNVSRRVAALGASSCLVLLLVGLATADSFVHPSHKPQQLAILHRTRGGATTGTVAAPASFLKPLPSSSTATSLLTVAHPNAVTAAEGGQQQVHGNALAKVVGGLTQRRGGAAAAVTGAGEKNLWEKVRLWVFIGLWYVFNVAFNIYNKKVRACVLMGWVGECGEWGG